MVVVKPELCATAGASLHDYFDNSLTCGGSTSLVFGLFSQDFVGNQSVTAHCKLRYMLKMCR